MSALKTIPEEDSPTHGHEGIRNILGTPLACVCILPIGVARNLLPVSRWTPMQAYAKRATDSNLTQ